MIVKAKRNIFKGRQKVAGHAHPILSLINAVLHQSKQIHMAEIKTRPTAVNVEEFISNIKDEQKRKDSWVLLEIMQTASGEAPQMWGGSIIGFGQVKIKSPNSGREVDWLRIGFAPRKANFSLYISGNINSQHAEALKKLGKHKTGVGCLYINKLADVDLSVLKGMIEASLTKEFFFK